jgi:hypothetical protein
MPSEKEEKKPEENTTQQEPTKEHPAYTPEKVLLSWKSSSRPFQKHSREYWVRFITIAAIFGVLLYIIEGIMPVLLLIAIVFLYYVLSTVEPEAVEYGITNKGIKVLDKLTEWPNIMRFWFTQRLNQDIVIFQTLTMPGRLELVVPSELKDKLKKIVLPYIPEEETPPTNFDKAADWVAKKLTETPK